MHEMLGQHKGSESGSDFVKYNLVEDYFEDTNSTWKFGFALGGEVSFGFENESSAEGEIISNSKELWTNVNGVFGLIVHEELTYTAADGSGTSNYRRTEQSLGTGDDTVKERVEPTSWSPEDYVEDPDKEGRPLQDILDEYEDRKRNILRWEELLSKETDPARKKMLRDLISGEENILNVLRQEALAAGATKDQLGISDKQAAEEARNNPIDPNEPFTSPSGTESS